MNVLFCDNLESSYQDSGFNALFYVNIYSYPFQCSTLLHVCVVLIFSQARNLVPGNTSLIKVTVTEVATLENTATNQTVVTFVIAFTENTTLVENFTTVISEPSIVLKYVQAVIPAGMYVCSSTLTQLVNYFKNPVFQLNFLMRF